MAIAKPAVTNRPSLDEMFVQAVRAAFAAKTPAKVNNAPPVLSLAISSYGQKHKLDCAHVDAYIYRCYTMSPYERGESLPINCY